MRFGKEKKYNNHRIGHSSNITEKRGGQTPCRNESKSGENAADQDSIIMNEENLKESHKQRAIKIDYYAFRICPFAFILIALIYFIYFSILHL